MKKTITVSLAIVLAFGLSFAQNSEIYSELSKHPERLNGTDMLCPSGPVQLSAAPKGYEAFYISQYARHGARYAWQDDLYETFNTIFTKAEQEENLTEAGAIFKQKFDKLYPEMRYRTGELTTVGWNQQQDLAKRMYKNFPGVFTDGAKVDAYTSTSTRCVMTMSSYCLGLKEMNPELDIVENFGYVYLPAILPLSSGNPFIDKHYRRSPLLFDETWDEYIARKVDTDQILSRLFKNVDKVLPKDQRWHLLSYFYFFVNGMQSIENGPDLSRIFTSENRIALWEIDNFQFFTEMWPTHFGYMPIVKDIIAKTDEAIENGKKGATLRFGHDYTILPLMMILGINGMDHNPENADEISKYIQVSNVPMGANVQFVFYRSRKNPEILFKVLLNGEEASLPLATDKYPYYTWSSFKEYYGKVISDNSVDTEVGPWVTNVTENSASILWTTTTSGLGWVETEDGTRIYDTFAGRRTFGRFHRVDVSGLEKGAAFKYRIGGNYLTDDSNPYWPQFEGEWKSQSYCVNLFNSDDKSVTFSMMNDIHMNSKAFHTLASGIDPQKADLIFLDGDIVSAGNYDIDRLVRHEIAPMGEIVHNMPVQFARGNHEGRGNGIKNVAAIYPNNASNTFYYAFRQGPAAFLVLDAGETHDNRAEYFSGKPVYEDYIMEQVEWAKKAVKEESFADAPLKICILHVPMIDHPNKNGYKLQRWLNANVLPFLNSEGFDIMLGADLHEQMECLPGTMNNSFPIIVNNTCERLDFNAEDGKITVKCVNADGDTTYSNTFTY